MFEMGRRWGKDALLSTRTRASTSRPVNRETGHKYGGPVEPADKFKESMECGIRR